MPPSPPRRRNHAQQGCLSRSQGFLILRPADHALQLPRDRPQRRRSRRRPRRSGRRPLRPRLAHRSLQPADPVRRLLLRLQRRPARLLRRRPRKSGCSGSRHHRPMATLRRLVSGALDLALPASCSGCGREGQALCPACLPAVDARLALPGGTPIGLPADIPMPLLQLEWCATFQLQSPLFGSLRISFARHAHQKATPARW